MSEVEASKSHATRWIVGVVLAVVLYLGSAAPVGLLIFHYEVYWRAPRSHSKTARFVMIGTQYFYKPANWVWDQPGLEKIEDKWVCFWQNIPPFSNHPAPKTGGV